MAQQVEPLTIRLLGCFEVWRNGSLIEDPAWGRKRAKSLLGVLLTDPGQPFSHEQIIEMLLGDRNLDRALNYLYSLASRLRTALEPSLARAADSTFILREGSGYRFNPEAPFTLDTQSFEALTLQGDRLLSRKRWAEALDRFRKAADLYRGDFVPEALYDDWARSSRDRCHTLHIHVLERLAECCARTGSLDSAIHTCDDLIGLQPWNETAYRQKMYYQYCQGNLGAAEETYRLCVERLADHLAVEPSEETSALHGRILQGDAPKVERWIPNNLLHLLTTFVGRKEELQTITEHLRRSRLVTVTGFGGIGKTRLALEAGKQLLTRFGDGVWFVDLGLISNEQDIPRLICKTLKIEIEQGQEPADALSEHVRGKHSLVILDTCEHLIDACARLTEALLHASPELHVLATSREALDIGGEMVWDVPPLSTPAPDASLEALRRSDAVQLFCERAGAPSSPLPLTHENGPWIAELCRRLDGLPLALELAANTARTMPLPEMVDRLDHRLSLLVRGRRTAPERHKTLSAMIDWSYELLSPEEQAVFRRLATFAGGCTAEMAATVCSDETISSTLVLEHLRALVAKSLLVFDSVTGRYRLLDTLREYATERLQESGDEGVHRTRHLRVVLDLALRADTRGPMQRQWLERLESELENLRAGLSWAIESKAFEDGLSLAGSNPLRAFWQRNRHAAEAADWLQRLLQEAANLKGPAVLDALSALGALQSQLGHSDEAKMTLQRSVEMSRSLGDETCLTTALVDLANAEWFAGHLDQAAELLEETIELDRRIGRESGVAACLGNLGSIRVQQGEPDAAVPILDEALGIARRIQHRYKEAGILASLGRAHERLGNYSEATRNYNAALELNREIGFREGERQIHTELATLGLGCGTTYRGDPDGGRIHAQQAVKIGRELGDANSASDALYNQAMLLCSLGDYDGAITSLTECLPFARTAGWRTTDLVPFLAEALAASGDPRRGMMLIGAAEAAAPHFRDAYGDHVYDDANRVETCVRAALGDKAAEDALAEGHRLDLDKLLDELLGHASK